MPWYKLAQLWIWYKLNLKKVLYLKYSELFHSFVDFEAIAFMEFFSAVEKAV